MSDYESHKGKIRKVNQKGELMLGHMVQIMKNNGDIIDESNEILDTFMDKYYKKYFVVKGDLYEFVEHEEIENFDTFCTLTPNEDGTISFHSTFYNGGTCLSEMLEDELKKLNK
jgi:hypothetical protein